MRLLYIFIAIIISISCKKKAASYSNKKPVTVIKTKNQKNNAFYKNAIQNIVVRKQIMNNMPCSRNWSLENEFTTALIDTILPYWYGTSWNFNGTTTMPQKGSIACGYFVATTLQDVGVKLNRIKFGQAPSNVFIKRFSQKEDTKLFLNKSPQETLSFFMQKGKGVYIIGLDSHVGFVYFDGNKLWFIHSKWYKEKCVIKEDYLSSSIIIKSKYKLLGKISNNKMLLKKWFQTKSAL